LEVVPLYAGKQYRTTFAVLISDGVPTASKDQSRLGTAYHSLYDEASGILNSMHIAQKFEKLLDSYRHPDGSRWTGQQLDEATGGVVPRSYFTNLRKGRIESPGYEKMAAIAKAMGFPPEAWFKEGVSRTPSRSSDESAALPEG
jgi:transcriptional regulator with XRE-family HTH domain